MAKAVATKADIERAIRTYCDGSCTDGPARKCADTLCPLFRFRLRRPATFMQTDLFRQSNKEEFFAEALSAALAIKADEFTMDDVRKRAKVVPLHDNWWGTVTRLRGWRGVFVFAGHRSSATKSRRGGALGVWRRRGA